MLIGIFTTALIAVFIGIDIQKKREADIEKYRDNLMFKWLQEEAELRDTTIENTIQQIIKERLEIVTWGQIVDDFKSGGYSINDLEKKHNFICDDTMLKLFLSL